jgi:hypothetical protein
LPPMAVFVKARLRACDPVSFLLARVALDGFLAGAPTRWTVALSMPLLSVGRGAGGPPWPSHRAHGAASRVIRDSETSL